MTEKHTLKEAVEFYTRFRALCPNGMRIVEALEGVVELYKYEDERFKTYWDNPSPCLHGAAVEAGGVVRALEALDIHTLVEPEEEKAEFPQGPYW